MNVSCDKIQSLLDSYLIGELPLVDSDQVDQHLANCGQCRALFDQHREIADCIGDLPQAQCPKHLSDAIESATWRQGNESNPWQRICALFTQSSKSPGFGKQPSWKAATIGFSAAFLATCLLVFISAQRTNPDRQGGYTASEIHLAKKQLQWSLTHVVQTIDHTNEGVVTGLVQEGIPKIIKNRIKSTTSAFQGESL